LRNNLTGLCKEYAATQIPRARLVVFDAGGHLLVGHDEEVRREIADFIRETTSGGFQFLGTKSPARGGSRGLT